MVRGKPRSQVIIHNSSTFEIWKIFITHSKYLELIRIKKVKGSESAKNQN